MKTVEVNSGSYSKEASKFRLISAWLLRYLKLINDKLTGLTLHLPHKSNTAENRSIFQCWIPSYLTWKHGFQLKTIVSRHLTLLQPWNFSSIDPLLLTKMIYNAYLLGNACSVESALRSEIQLWKETCARTSFQVTAVLAITVEEA